MGSWRKYPRQRERPVDKPVSDIFQEEEGSERDNRRSDHAVEGV